MELAYQDVDLKEQMMDPISLVLAAYLDSVQSRVNARLTDTLGTELKAVLIDYQGVRVPFRYQSNLTYYSHCTVIAKSLFAKRS